MVKQTLVVLRCLLSLLATHFLPIPNASKDKQLLQPKERFALKRRHRGPILHVFFFFYFTSTQPRLIQFHVKGDEAAKFEQITFLKQPLVMCKRLNVTPKV